MDVRQSEIAWAQKSMLVQNSLEHCGVAHNQRKRHTREIDQVDEEKCKGWIQARR